MKGSPEAGGPPSARQRGYGAIIMAAGALWTVSGLVVVGSPTRLTARVYDTAVPAAVALLLIGVTGVKQRLGGPGPAPTWRAGFTAMWRRLDNVLDTGYDHHSTRGLRDVHGTSTATRVGTLGVRAGCVFVVAASLLAIGSGDVTWRSMLWFGWFLLYAGAAALGVAVATTDELPRRPGTLLLVGSLPVFQAATMVATGAAADPDSFGPVVPLALTTPLRVTVAILLWLVFGAAWAWLGWSLWSEQAR